MLYEVITVGNNGPPPSSTKIFMMLREVAPIERRMAMSRCFSITTMIRVVAMLKAATRTMIANRNNFV